MFWLIIGMDFLVHHGKEDMQDQSSLLPVFRKWVVVVVIMVRNGKKAVFAGFFFSSFVPS